MNSTYLNNYIKQAEGKSLHDLVNELWPNVSYGLLNEFDIIKIYLSTKNNIAKAPGLITEILTNEIEQKSRYIDFVKTWGSYPSDYYYHDYDKDTAYHLDTLTRKMQLGLNFTENDIEWMKTFDLNKVKGLFWQDLYAVIQYYQGLIDKPKFTALNPEFDCKNNNISI